MVAQKKTIRLFDRMLKAMATQPTAKDRTQVGHLAQVSVEAIERSAGQPNVCCCHIGPTYNAYEARVFERHTQTLKLLG
jgi:hypothetical protein